MEISAKGLDFKQLNELIKKDSEDIVINDCFGQRFLGSGLSGIKNITINGTPGNALASYLDGSNIIVHGNVQDAACDTMNEGTITVHGNAGDALGYAMRGGVIYVKGDSGYRTGIHMKEYEQKKPVIVIGGKTGSFLGEYLAGGIIVVLGLNEEEIPVGDFTGTGMHGGKIFIRTKNPLEYVPSQLLCTKASEEDLNEIKGYVKTFSEKFDVSEDEIYKENFYVLKPNKDSSYKKTYTIN